MKWSSPTVAAALLAPLQAHAMLRCDNIQASGQKFDFSKLKGPHSVTTTRVMPLATFNTTYTLDLCAPLKKKGGGKKEEECPNGTRVCAIKRRIKDGKDDIEEVIAIAGDLENHGGKPLDHVATRLKTSDSHSDSQKVGLRLVLNGGRYPLDGGKRQQAIVELLCNQDKEGTEGEWKPEDQYEGAAMQQPFRFLSARDDDGSGDGGDGGDGQNHEETQLKKDGAALIWDSFEDREDVRVLRLTWYTKYACESSAEDPSDQQSNHWGFFTWFIVLPCGLLTTNCSVQGISWTAAYLIFGSWLNYNRYGARGWDLLPHGDTIRDVPYLLKDWTRRLINTLQGSGSRGGYSAV